MEILSSVNGKTECIISVRAHRNKRETLSYILGMLRYAPMPTKICLGFCVKIEVWGFT